MQPKHHMILYTFLSIALVLSLVVGAAFWAQAAKARESLEDGYVKTVLEAQEHLQAIAIKLSKAPVAGNARQTVKLLSGVSIQADSAASGLSGLPLSHAAMQDTIKFCNQTSEYAMSLALAVAGGTPLDDAAAQTLAELSANCSQLVSQLAIAREQMLSGSLSMSGGGGFYDDAHTEARPLEQVADKDGGMDYPVMVYDGAFSDARYTGPALALGDERITAEQAVGLAREFVGEKRVSAASPNGETAGKLEAYGVTLHLTDGTQLSCEMTKTGGKMLWMVPEHADFAQTLTLTECEALAREFLTERGYYEMEPSHFQVYDGLAVMSFVSVQSSVLLYPDLIKLQLRMDTGETVGFESNNYLMNHRTRENLTPTLTSEEAISRVNSRLKPENARLCVIPYKSSELLCYEISGTYQDGEYLVYIDAATGDEAEIFKIIHTTQGIKSA